MSQKTDMWIDEHADELVEDTRAVVRFPSVEAAAVEGRDDAPFGQAVRDVEDYVLKLADGYGFATGENKGYYATVDAGVEEGVEKEILAVVCHLDVVPEGLGWTHPCFGAEMVDGKIFGRGTVDDKGPAMAALTALRAVRDCGYKFKRQVRLIMGLNEESGMLCLDKYCAEDRLPDIAFTPDGSYPLCNSEFGICHAVFKKEYKSNVKFESGVAANVVPPLATAEVCGNKFETTGVQAHASMPWDGENAAQKMLVLLAAAEGLNDEDKAVLEVLSKHLGTGYFGEGFDLVFENQTGKLTLNLGVVNWCENGFEMVLDLRVPTAVTENEVKTKLSSVFEKCGAVLADWSWSDGYYLSEDTEIVSKLMKVYQDRTGDTESKPISMGGGTYARHLPNAVSFGPEGVMDVCTCHIPDEYITKEQLKFTSKMLADAIISIACEE